MTRPAAYLRPMRRWWRRDPYFVRYMWREATALAVAVYAIVLGAGVVCLALGESAWNGWLGVLRTPWSIALHALLFAAMVVHTHSWFRIMPKTLPMLHIGGRRVQAATITCAGWAATLVASALLLALVAWSGPR